MYWYIPMDSGARFTTSVSFLRGHCRDGYTEPRILMDSIRSPGTLQGQFLEFTWSLHGVHVDLSLGTDTYSLYTPYILLIYSSWTPDGLHQDGYFPRTPDSLLSIPKQESRRTPQKLHKYSANLNLIYNVIKKQISLQRFEPYLLSKLCLTTQPQVL